MPSPLHLQSNPMPSPLYLKPNAWQALVFSNAWGGSCASAARSPGPLHNAEPHTLQAVVFSKEGIGPDFPECVQALVFSNAGRLGVVPNQEVQDSGFNVWV